MELAGDGTTARKDGEANEVTGAARARHPRPDARGGAASGLPEFAGGGGAAAGSGRLGRRAGGGRRGEARPGSAAGGPGAGRAGRWRGTVAGATWHPPTGAGRRRGSSGRLRTCPARREGKIRVRGEGRPGIFEERSIYRHRGS